MAEPIVVLDSSDEDESGRSLPQGTTGAVTSAASDRTAEPAATPAAPPPTDGAAGSAGGASTDDKGTHNRSDESNPCIYI